MSVAQFTRVAFEYSTDGVNYIPLGNGTPTGGSWMLSGLSLATGQNIFIRARGYYRTGGYNGSESITESVRNAFLTAPAGTPTPSPTSANPNRDSHADTAGHSYTGAHSRTDANAVALSYTDPTRRQQPHQRPPQPRAAMIPGRPSASSMRPQREWITRQFGPARK